MRSVEVRLENPSTAWKDCNCVGFFFFFKVNAICLPNYMERLQNSVLCAFMWHLGNRTCVQVYIGTVKQGQMIFKFCKQ